MNSKANSYILIVEDSDDLRSLLREFFEGEGFIVRLAADGQEALDLLKLATALPSFILLDLMMPVMDGYTFRKEQQKDPRIAGIPIVIMTADGQAEEKTKDMNAKAFLRKPIQDVEELVHTAMQFYS